MHPAGQLANTLVVKAMPLGSAEPVGEPKTTASLGSEW